MLLLRDDVSRGIVPVLAIGAMFCLTATAAAQQRYAFGRLDFATGQGPQAVAIADLNGDSRPDLVVANGTDNTVSILLARADGTFNPRLDYPVGSDPTSVAVGDFNGDGKPDLAVSNYNDNNVSILLGNGDGTFSPNSAVAVAGNPIWIATADFNADGKADLAVANQASGTVSVLLGNGDGSFKPHADFFTGRRPMSLAVGDFNADGKMDVVTANQIDNDIALLLGNGDGTLQPPVTFSLGPNASPNAVAVGDFNGDGKLDVATASNYGLQELLGDGTGSFSGFYGGTNGFFVGLATGDFNGDGKTDAVATSLQNYLVTVSIGGGSGLNVTFGGGAAPVAVAVADLNGDNRPDVVVVNHGSNTLSVYLNAAGTFDAASPLMSVGTALSAITGDFNGDGKLDVAMTVGTLLGNGDGTFRPLLPFSSNQFFFATGDFNNDGKLDLATFSGVMLGHGDGTFANPIPYAMCPSSGFTALPSAFGDFNRDGKLDYVTGCSIGSNVQVSIFLGNGDGTFRHFADVPVTGGSVATGDFNNDGKLDLAVAFTTGTTTGGVSILIGNGDGTFQPHVDYATAGGSRIFAGDFNGDGKTDLVVNGSLLLGNGDGTFKPAVTTATYPSQGTISGDFNGDGRLDLAYNFTNNSGVFTTGFSLLLAQSDGTFQAHSDFLTGEATGIAAGDFNGDGALDIVVADNLGNAIIPYLNSLSAGLSQGKLAFGKQTVSTTSAAQAVALTNLGGARFSISSISASGDFAQTNNCGSALSVGASCTITVTFAPTGAGSRTGAITVTDTAGSSPQLVILSGTGLAPQPTATLSSVSVNFGSVAIGTAGTQSVTLTDFGTVALNVMGVSISIGDFAQTNNCAPSVASAATCTIQITFRPTASGPRAGIVTILDNAASSPQSISLSGIGTGPVVGISPTSFTFTGQPVGTTSASQALTLSNVGNAALGITSVATSGDFGQSNNCGATLVAGTNCTVNLAFTPAAAGSRSGALTISDNAANSPQSVTLSGTGTILAASVSPSTLTFGNQSVNTTSTSQTVTLTNAGDASLTIASIAVSGPAGSDFAPSNGCGASLAPGGSCTISVTFTPSTLGTRSATLTIADNAPGSPQSVAMNGTGLGALANLSVSNLSFGAQPVGAASPSLGVELTNGGNTSLAVSSVAIAGADRGDFAQTNSCMPSLAAGFSCVLSVIFTPTAAGQRAASTVISDNAPGSPHTIKLSGLGTDFSVVVAAGSATSATISPGGTANYVLSFVSEGVAGTLSLACSGAPALASCIVSPSSVPLSPGSTGTATVSVGTAAPSLTVRRFDERGSGPILPRAPFWPLMLLAALPPLWILLASGTTQRRWDFRPTLALVLVMAILSGCGGGTPVATHSSGTQPGTYVLTITAKLSGTTHQINLQLTVQ